MDRKLYPRLILCFALAGLAFPSALAHAANPAGANSDASALLQMEKAAASTDPRDRCYRYTELLRDWTDLAGRELASGDDAGAAEAMQHADADTEHLKSALSGDSRKLKNAEQLMERSVRRLADMLRVSPMEEHDAMQAVLRHVSSVHDELLAAVFAH